MKFDPEAMKREIKTQLTGTWQFVGIEIQNEPVNAQMEKPTSENGETTQSSATNAQTPTTLELPQLDIEEQTSQKDRVQLSPITVEEREDTQKIAAAKMALASANRKNLTLEFYEERTSLYYRGSNRGRKVTGQCNVIASASGGCPVCRFSDSDAAQVRRCLSSSLLPNPHGLCPPGASKRTPKTCSGLAGKIL